MQPEECQSMGDIRGEIDTIDHQIIQLLSQRLDYVHSAAKFKTSAGDVKSPERLRSMLQERRAWAEELDLDPDIIEKLYQDLVNYFIHQEMKHWQQREA